ncbi:Uncharacterized protein Rs2_09968 [Raphanus sativus]|nr:Uncharacterized protein Rs2_09968 [Raphanus sativus]
MIRCVSLSGFSLGSRVGLFEQVGLVKSTSLIRLEGFDAPVEILLHQAWKGKRFSIRFESRLHRRSSNLGIMGDWQSSRAHFYDDQETQAGMNVLKTVEFLCKTRFSENESSNGWGSFSCS